MQRIKQPALRVDDELTDTIEDAQRSQWSVVVQPPEHADGDLLESAEQLWQSLHEELDRVSFELHRTEAGAIEFHLVCQSKATARATQRHILSNYPRAACEVERSRLPIETGDAVAAARVEYEQDQLMPLLSADSKHAPDGDPSRPILETLAHEHGRCVLQTVVEPIGQGWTSRYARGTPLRREDHRWWRLPPDRHSRFDAIPDATAFTLMVAGGWWLVTQWFAGLASGVLPLFIGLGMVCCAFWWSTLFGHPFRPTRLTSSDAARHLRDKPWSEDKATRGERKAADLIDKQGRKKSFRVSMRIVTMAETSAAAHDYLESVGTQLTSAYHNPSTTQQLAYVPVSRPQRRINAVVERLAQRARSPKRWRDRLDSALWRSHRQMPMIMPDFELAGMLGHLPDSDSGGAGAIDYAPPRLRTQIPPSAPRYLRPEEAVETARKTPQNAPLARAGRLLAERLPGPLADRLAERGVGIGRDEDGRSVVSLPEWMSEESELDIDVDERITARHDSYGEVELKLIKEDDPTTHEDDGDVWMGSFLREIIESKQQRPRDDILIGYQKQQGGRVREVAVDFDTIYTHIFVQGVTGGGKSTLAEALLAQWAHAGYGFAVPDPSGELVKDILKWLPEHRHDDVVWYSPEPDVADELVGYNPFEIPESPGDDGYDSAEDAAVDRFINGLKAAEDGDDWGNRMLGVCRNLSRVMIASEEPFTLVDMHDALNSENGREKLAERAGKGDQFVAKYTEKIANFDDSELDALLRRLNEWVESSVSRGVVAIRESSIDVEEIVQEGKILLFDNDLTNSALSRMLGTSIWSHIWDVCEDRPEDEREPFCVLADEFDDLITPEMNVGEQLRNARKYKLCLVLMTQYLDAIGNKDAEQAIDEECSTTITLPLKGEDADRVASRLGLDDEEYLTQLARYHALVEIEINGNPRGPFEIALPAPMAPERTADEARSEIIEPALARDGRAPPTNQEIAEAQILSGETSAIGDGETSAQRYATALKSIEDEAIRQGCPGEFIELADCVGRINDYLGESYRNADDAWRNALQSVPETQLAERQTDGTHEVKVLDRPWLGVGDDVTSGGREHALIMEDAYQPLSQLGFVVDVLDQDAGAANQSMPDALAKPDDALDLDALDPVEDAGEIADRVNEFRTSDDHSQIVRLTGVKDGYLEAEHSTSGTQPSQAIMNAIEAHNDDRRCLYLIRPELASKLHGYLEAPAGCRSDHDVHGETRFYTRTGALTISGEDMTRPGTNDNVWIRDEDTDQIVLRDDSGTEHARFDSASEVFNDASAYPDEGSRTITPPMIPDHELDSGSMQDVEWDIIVVPEPETDEDDERQRLTPLDLKLYQPIGNNVPLIDLPVSPSDRIEQNEESQQINTDDLADAISDARFSDD